AGDPHLVDRRGLVVLLQPKRTQRRRGAIGQPVVTSVGHEHHVARPERDRRRVRRDQPARPLEHDVKAGSFSRLIAQPPRGVQLRAGGAVPAGVHGGDRVAEHVHTVNISQTVDARDAQTYAEDDEALAVSPPHRTLWSAGSGRRPWREPMPYATAADGVRLYYETLGSGSPLLLVSGQASDHTLWDGVRDDFAGEHRVIVFDLRGTGQSDKPEEPPYTTHGFAQDAIAILDELGIARAHAYGVSMGGRVCQWLGIDFPDRLRPLVLGRRPPGTAHGVPRSPEVDARLFGPTDPEARGAAWIDGLFTPAGLAAHPEYAAQVREALSNGPPAYALRLHYLASEGHEAW